ncbi:hypothetical protein RHCRD62_60164 [Rhodococcus sp. RD6.2]|nr:hypothetical protein RHCRD62_60164 [Rhodococcus sp. RD6.2]
MEASTTTSGRAHRTRPATRRCLGESRHGMDRSRHLRRPRSRLGHRPRQVRRIQPPRPHRGLRHHDRREHGRPRLCDAHPSRRHRLCGLGGYRRLADRRLRDGDRQRVRLDRQDPADPGDRRMRDRTQGTALTPNTKVSVRAGLQ